MITRFLQLSTSRKASLMAALASTTLLTGCYVVPTHPVGAYPPAVHVPVAPPQPLVFAARLYPANPLATDIGMVSAVVTNDLNGRGAFSTTIQGESFNGEATRQSGTTREGVANGAGNRGSFISCRYSMNSATQGTGQCRLSNGAIFTMHLGG
jgi:hypothetical protein